MDIALLIARLFLIALFALAAITKIADRKGSREMVLSFGFPPALAGLLGMLLPILELATVVLLAIPKFVLVGGWTAIGLLLVFTAVIAYNVALARTPNCRCFGQLSAAPIGKFTILRNLFLLALALFVAWGGSRSFPMAWLPDLSLETCIRFLLVATLVAIAGSGIWLFFHVLRQQGRMLIRLEKLEKQLASVNSVLQLQTPNTGVVGLPIGHPAPAFSLPDLEGNFFSLDDFHKTGKPLLLIFTDPDCQTCTALLPNLSTWQHDSFARTAFILISVGSPESNRLKAAAHGLTSVLIQEGHQVTDAYRVRGTPSAVLIGEDGLIRSQLAEGPKDIFDLVQSLNEKAYRQYA